MLDTLSPDLIKIVASHLKKPNQLLCCCQAASSIGHDADALALWLRTQFGPLGLLALTNTPCSNSWNGAQLRQTCQLILEGRRNETCSACPTQEIPFQMDAISSILRWAALHVGDSQLVRLLLSSSLINPSPGSPPNKGSGPLFPAQIATSPAPPKAVAQALLSHLLCSLLNEACGVGPEAVVRELLDAGAMPKGCLTLKAAVQRGHTGVVCALLDSGRVNPREDSDCALRTAAKYGQVACVALLLSVGCCPQARQAEALCLSVGGGHTEAARLLLQSGADASARPGLLQLAVGAVDDSEPLVRMLLDAGARDEGGAALCHATTSGKEQVVQLLLGCSKRESSVSIVPDVLAVALQQAVVNGHLNIAAKLLDVGAPIDLALLALRRSFPDAEAVLKLLEGYAGNVQCSQEVLDDALSIAAAEADAVLLGLLLRWGAHPMARDCQALRKAVLHGRITCVKSLLSVAGVAGLKQQMPCCVMRAAVQRGHLEVVSELLSVSLWPSPSAHHCCSDPHTCAARMLCVVCTPAMANLLLSFGAGIHAGAALRLIACGKAPSWRNEEVVQLMMDAMISALSAGLRPKSGDQASMQGGCWHQQDEEYQEHSLRASKRQVMVALATDDHEHETDDPQLTLQLSTLSMVL